MHCLGAQFDAGVVAVDLRRFPIVGDGPKYRLNVVLQVSRQNAAPFDRSD
jgi:hypothetical protein